METTGTSSLAANSVERAGSTNTNGVGEPELRAFVGARPDTYLRHFRNSGGSDRGAIAKRKFSPSWHWPAFLVTVPWLFYRKMYSGGIILIALPVLFEHILPGALFLGSGIVIAIAAGVFAKSWYIDHAVNRILRANREHSSDDDRWSFIRRAGGVSAAGAVFGLLTQGVTLSVIILGLLPSGVR